MKEGLRVIRGVSLNKYNRIEGICLWDVHEKACVQSPETQWYCVEQLYYTLDSIDQF